MIVSAQRAAELIQSGNVVAIPTETVYGLAADASNVLAVRKIFELKRRPAGNPLIVHVAGPDQIATFSDKSPEILLKLVDQFWPGPLTLVMPKRPTVLDIITAGLNTVALRMPNHPKALSVIERAGPVAAPSANRSGRPSPTRPEHVTEDFGAELPVIDGGACAVGLESTVLDITGDSLTILRPGKITAEEIEDLLNQPVEESPSNLGQTKRSPGTRYSHYRPDAAVQWMESPPLSSHKKNYLHVYHTHEPAEMSINIICFNRNYEELARSLYDIYRTADQKNYSHILIEPLPHAARSSILPAVYDRIERSISR